MVGYKIFGTQIGWFYQLSTNSTLANMREVTRDVCVCSHNLRDQTNSYHENPIEWGSNVWPIDQISKLFINDFQSLRSIGGHLSNSDNTVIHTDIILFIKWINSIWKIHTQLILKTLVDTRDTFIWLLMKDFPKASINVDKILSSSMSILCLCVEKFKIDTDWH